jgi:hypothetical protein
MTFTHRTLNIAAAFVLSAATVSAQTAVQPHGHKYLDPADATSRSEVTARVEALDQRIAMLTADMKMLVGELKIQAMTDLIEALVERQRLIDADIKRMHEQMWAPMMDGRRHAEPPSDLEPEAMCSPFV